MIRDFHVPGFHDQPASITNFLPPIERAAFILHAMDGMTCDEIADRLAIGAPAVTEFMGEAWIVREAVQRGAEPGQRSSSIRQETEASLRARFRTWCEARLAAHGFKARIEWRAHEDEDQTVVRVIFDSLDPYDLETFLLSRVDGFDHKQIARRMGTVQWIVERRMVRAIAAIHRGYCSFADWLVRLGRDDDVSHGVAHRPSPRNSAEAVR